MQAKFHGTIVTKESFLEWRKKFEEEMNLQLETKDNSSTQSMRLTGMDMLTCIDCVALVTFQQQVNLIGSEKKDHFLEFDNF